MLRGRIKAGEDRPFLSRQNPAALPVTLPSPLRPAVSERLRPLPGGAAPAAAAAPAPRAERAGRGAPHSAPGDFPLPPPGTHGPAVRGFRRRRGLSAPDGGTAPLQPSRCRVLGVRHRRQPVVVAAECPPPPRQPRPRAAQAGNPRTAGTSRHGAWSAGGFTLPLPPPSVPAASRAPSGLEAPAAPGARSRLPALPPRLQPPSLPRGAACAPSHR